MQNRRTLTHIFSLQQNAGFHKAAFASGSLRFQPECGSPSILVNDELICKISFHEAAFEAIQSCLSGFLISRITKSDGEPPGKRNKLISRQKKLDSSQRAIRDSRSGVTLAGLVATCDC